MPWVCYRRRNQWLRLALALFCLPLTWLPRVAYLAHVEATIFGVGMNVGCDDCNDDGRTSPESAIALERGEASTCHATSTKLPLGVHHMWSFTRTCSPPHEPTCTRPPPQTSSTRPHVVFLPTMTAAPSKPFSNQLVPCVATHHGAAACAPAPPSAQPSLLRSDMSS